ncbi:molybdate ABC transporter permease subunit [Rhodovibrio salinarum]|uniref:Molybdenum transport system permease n=1 Tax=Rhodovibrio salinarum TaxID=1087 RepID=A0A934V1T0_9PROT|nr:molybdate ABC transporter permease subunit [Rhodovibrio salinarum]MBK1698983.1 molybdate ABC transporter permease subunit [Rhodovibrio salinarum]
MPDLTPLEREALLLSIRVALLAVTVTLPLALATAWLLARRRFPGKTLLEGLVHLPMVLPPVVVGYLLLLAFGRNGPLGGWLNDVVGLTLAFTWQGAAVAAGVMAFPLMVRAIRLSLEAIDSRLESAAHGLGANPLDRFLTITLPLAAPGLLVAAILGFARSLGEFGATITFVSNIPGETRTLPLAIYSLVQQLGGEAGAVRLVVLSIGLALLALAASELLARRLRRRLTG